MKARGHAPMVGLLLLGALAATTGIVGESPHSAIDDLERDARPGVHRLGGHEATLLLSRHPVLDPQRDALFVVGASIAYTDDEMESVRQFVYAGGRLLVAGDRGAGKDLLDRLGSGVTISGIALYSPVFAQTPERILARSTGEIAALPREVAIERPVSVQGGEPILLAPEPAWEDVNDNGRPDLTEPIVRGSVAAYGRYGEGLVVAVGSPLLMRDPDAPAAQAFLGFVLQGDRRLVVDEAHRPGSDPFGLNAVLSGHASAGVATGILIATLAAGAAIVLAPRLRAAATRRPPIRAVNEDPAFVGEILSELDPR